MERTGKHISFPCIKVSQPVGDFYIGSIPAQKLCEITFADIRRIERDESRDLLLYLGIQRPLDPKRVVELKKYVKTVDASFPTSVIIAVEESCAAYDDKKREMVLSEHVNAVEPSDSIPYDRIARILDGQHRLAGLQGDGKNFEINVSIFIGADIATQANIFSTVNLAQTKVRKSLAYDLFSVAKSRSPQKSCHLIAVALDSYEKSPFFERIKRLGVATEGRFNETITQATFVESLLRYISDDYMADRDLYLRGESPKLASADILKKLIFRNMFIEEKELEITDILFNYFDAVHKRWPRSWNDMGGGNMLNKTNGFRALMRFLRPAYLYLTQPGNVPDSDQFSKIFQRIDLKDTDFTIENFKPGTSGESKLYRKLVDESNLD